MRALAWIVCLAACDAGAKPAPPAPQQKPTTGEPTKQQVTTPGFDLAYLPADSDAVIHIDLARMRQSKLWPTYQQDVTKLIAPAFVDCDYSPTSDATTVDAGIPAISKVNVLVFRGIDRGKAMACLTKPTTRTTQSVVVHGDTVTVTSPTKMIRDIAFVDPHTMVVRSAANVPAQSMDDALKQTADAPLRKNADFFAAIASSKTPAGVVAVSRPGSTALADQMKTSGIKLGRFWGSIDLDTQLQLHYAMTVGSAAEATQLVATMKGQLDTPSIKQLFDRIDTHSQDATLTLDVTLGETKLASLAGMVRALLPAP